MRSLTVVSRANAIACTSASRLSEIRAETVSDRMSCRFGFIVCSRQAWAWTRAPEGIRVWNKKAARGESGKPAVSRHSEDERAPTLDPDHAPRMSRWLMARVGIEKKPRREPHDARTGGAVLQGVDAPGLTPAEHAKWDGRIDMSGGPSRAGDRITRLAHGRSRRRRRLAAAAGVTRATAGWALGGVGGVGAEDVGA